MKIQMTQSEAKRFISKMNSHDVPSGTYETKQIEKAEYDPFTESEKTVTMIEFTFNDLTPKQYFVLGRISVLAESLI